ncbi:pyridoxamine 5'-phosphate oxidase family protein [Mesobacillus selenatarsenatis]|uniref:General stress protein 26 n=1 Tax=Mesobacillus selenatarsenatis (strain DSM 18680 / JCM 14380 / FERM P-15431 / SF-1) TaxID=1321606 RepID=A0A0A8X1H9_MESS1|nr:pyridoxamine 5'-phosphate oxidase family protein [Mesobacillus selenatarsenatis]GAM13119.1 general stress protein 26 [Mesobacillus selenatarsenatis SF-1]
MDSQNLKEKITQVLGESKVGTLATVVGNKPHSRYMTFFNEDLTLYTPTSKETYKAEEIKRNPYVHILLGYEGEGMGDAYIEVQGKASIREEESLKEKFWNEKMEKWIESPNDPDYIILEIKPETIRLMNDNGEPETMNF